MQNQWNIRNFYRNDNNILNPRIPAYNLGHEGNILRYEFPLMAWCIAQIERVFGESILVTRFMMFLVGIIALIGFYVLSKEVFRDKNLAACGAWIMSLAPLFYYYTLNPMSDVWAMTAQIWMMAWSIRYYQTGRFNYLFYSVIAWSISGLCKLPYILFGVIPFSIVLFIYFQKNKSISLFIKSLSILFIGMVPVIAWYTFAIRSWKSMGVLKGIFGTQDRVELKSYFINTIDHWLPGELMNPAAFIFFILGILSLITDLRKKNNLFWILASGGIVVILYYLYEVNMIARIHDYYMLPFLVFLHLIILRGISLLWQHKLTGFVSIVCISILPGFVYPGVNNDYWSIDRNSYNVDWFYHSKELTDAVPRDSVCIILNDHTGTVKPYTIDKQGYVLDRDELPVEWMQDMILHRRTTYMYSDSRLVDSSEAILPYLGKLILQRGSVKIFQLVTPEHLVKVSQ